jgi:peptide/nickel transport system ATP-binding protein
MSNQPATLELRDLQVAYRVRGIDRQVLRGVSFSIAPGEAYGLVGESGCGKSTAAFAAMRYLPRNGTISGGSIHFEGKDITSIGDSEIRDLRTNAISMVYQNPIGALNPTIKIGDQVAEVFQLLGKSKSESLQLTEEALKKVQIADPTRVMGRFPHQLSGGMAQRVVIAMALASNPRLLVMDEPTTGLDATVEAEVLDLVRTLRKETGTSVLFISHNLGVIRTMCDRIGVLYAGSLVEEGLTETVLSKPTHPYTVGLLRCIPRGGLQEHHLRLARHFRDACSSIVAPSRRTSAERRYRSSSMLALIISAVATFTSRLSICRARLTVSGKLLVQHRYPSSKSQRFSM